MICFSERNRQSGFQKLKQILNLYSKSDLFVSKQAWRIFVAFFRNKLYSVLYMDLHMCTQSQHKSRIPFHHFGLNSIMKYKKNGAKLCWCISHWSIEYTRSEEQLYFSFCAIEMIPTKCNERRNGFTVNRLINGGFAAASVKLVLFPWQLFPLPG